MMKNIKKQILLMSIISSCLVQNSFAVSPSCRIKNIENVSKILCKGFHPIEGKKLDQKFKALVEQFNKTNQIAKNGFFNTLDNWKFSFLKDLKNTIGECRKEIFDSYSESSIDTILDHEKEPIYKELNRIYLSILNLKETSKNKTLQEVNSQIACLEGDLAKLGNSMMIGYAHINDIGKSILNIHNIKNFQDRKLEILKSKVIGWIKTLENEEHPAVEEKQNLKNALNSLLSFLSNRSIVSEDAYDILFNLFFDDKNKFINLSDNCNDALKISQDKDTDALIVNIMGVISQNHNFNPNFKKYLDEFGEEDRYGFKNILKASGKNFEKSYILLNKNRKPIRDKNLDLEKCKLKIPEGTKIIDVSDDDKYFDISMDKSHVNDPVFTEGPCCTDIEQGDVGDCYFLASLAALVQFRPTSILESIVDNNDGTVTIRFYDDKNNACYYKISKSVPQSKGAKNSYFWVRLFEKAYVFHRTKQKKLDPNFVQKVNYKVISGGKEHISMAHLCGSTYHGRIEREEKGCDGKTHCLPFIDEQYYKDKSVGEYSNEAIQFFDKIEERIRKHQALCASTHKEDNKVKGVFSYHAYSIVGTRKKQSTSGKDYKLIVLRNPWGHGTSCYENQDGRNILAEAERGRDDSGIFTMDLNDFLSVFTALDYCEVPAEH